jgi:hypothetical protein
MRDDASLCVSKQQSETEWRPLWPRRQSLAHAAAECGLALKLSQIDEPTTTRSDEPAGSGFTREDGAPALRAVHEIDKAPTYFDARHRSFLSIGERVAGFLVVEADILVEPI